jgi:hypothetical protein
MKTKTNKLGKGLAAGLAIALSVNAGDGLDTKTSEAELIKVEENETSISGYVSTGVHSKYLGIYGFSISENPVIQSEAGVNIGSLSLGTWTNYDPNRGFNEFDFFAIKSLETKLFNFSTDLWAFTSPNEEFGSCYTIGVSVGTKNLPINLDIHAIQAFGDDSHWGQLLQLRATKQIKVNDRLSLGLESRLTYNNGYFVNGNGLSVFSGALNANYDLGKGYYLTAYGRAQKSIDTIGGTFKDDSAVGISLGKKF